MFIKKFCKRLFGFFYFANFSAATAMHTEDWRLGTTLNLAEEERLWIEQGAEWDIGHQGYRKPALAQPVLTNWRLLR